MKLSKIKRVRILIATMVVLSIAFWFSLPKELFHSTYSTVIEDARGNLLAAQIAEDGQWRFPEMDSVPNKFADCIVQFEDRYFYRHPGVNPLAIGRAIIQNIRAGEVVSGGSTLTAQVMRLSRDRKRRNIWQKTVEFVLAVGLEVRYSKDEILALYASHAPFGGNVVGLEAAAWRYYGRSPLKLSWGESATLAVLPNAPSMIFPGKNQEILLAKRNSLLENLFLAGKIDSLTCVLSKLEPLPGKPKALPQIAPHLLTRVLNDGKQGKRIRTTINTPIQQMANRMVNKHHEVLKQNEIWNGAALVLDVETGNVLAYVGNTNVSKDQSGKFVDIIQAPRSTGSTLKPILYALMQQEGTILPTTLVADIPTHIAGYAPKNFDKKYHGAVHANNALARSLNIPAVRMLQEYGLERFTWQLKQLNFSTITRSADHYGLSIILGGAETTLWDLAGVYAGMARNLLHYTHGNSTYNPADFHPARYEEIKQYEVSNEKQHAEISAGSTWLTFEALTEMDRPEEGSNWHLFESSRKIAWKTGTSFGFRDAWAIGITPQYVVAVWIGNANGEGRPGLTGSRAAAPLMFDIYKQLAQTSWFRPPYDDLVDVVVCRESGYKATALCPHPDTLLCCANGDRTIPCDYHKQIHLDKTENFQVYSDCYPVHDMVKKVWFVLPPVMERFYKNTDALYKPLPPWLEGCSNAPILNLAMVYPKNNAKLYLPVGLDQNRQRTVFEAAHNIADATIYWHLDEEYLGSTIGIHKKEIYSSPGIHYLTLTDNMGETRVIEFEVLRREER